MLVMGTHRVVSSSVRNIRWYFLSIGDRWRYLSFDAFIEKLEKTKYDSLTMKNYIDAKIFKVLTMQYLLWILICNVYLEQGCFKNGMILIPNINDNIYFHTLDAKMT